MAIRPRRLSLQGRLLSCCAVALLAGMACAMWLNALTGSLVLAIAAGLMIGLVLLSIMVSGIVDRITDRVAALVDSADSLRDADFSFTVADQSDDEIGDLIRAYNAMVATLRAERQNLHQRELMLDTVLQASPVVLVLCNDADRVIYANNAARTLFNRGQAFSGRRLIGDIAAAQPESLRDAIGTGLDAMVTLDTGDGAERYHLSCNDFVLNARGHRLYLMKRLTHELNRQEVATWKKVIRLIGHELNNSLAPISSLAHTAQLLIEREQPARAADLLQTIEARSAHLKEFIEGYSQFAKLPTPQPELVVWDRFFARLQSLHPFHYTAEAPGLSGRFDPRQLEQVVINLCKNAQESGSPADAIDIRLRTSGSGCQFSVCDRGPGMSDETLASALLPFYSTKRSGSGLGLSLCREIVDAHEGRISLANRLGGGLRVSIWLPHAINKAGSGRSEPARA